MDEINLQELRNVQIEILDFFHAFCLENNIHYSLACGTLLGAIRHKGYIPWDDDIDVQMVRPEYNKFLRLFPKSINSTYELFSLGTNPNYSLPFAKLADKRTFVIEYRNSTVKAVNIDIFPVDYIKTLHPEEDTTYRRVKIIRKLWLIRSLKINSSRNLYQNILLFFLKVLTFYISARFLADRINKTAEHTGSEASDYLFEIVDGSFYLKSFSKDAFTSTVQVEFEGNFYHALKGYDEYLTACYGDYMKLPPEEGRISHHKIKAFWK